MSVRNLSYLFAPRAIAVFGASNRPGSVGAVVTRNLLGGGFAGPIMPVNPHEAAVAGVMACPTVEALPSAPDLAVICTPPTTVPGLIAALAARGARAAIVLTAGLEAPGPDGRPLAAAILTAARPHLLRILGPNCVGLLVPGHGRNASFAHLGATPGKIAFISQSGALCTAVLDWAAAGGIGFSHFVSLGNAADVDFGDVLDYLAGDAETRAILLCIESITQARKFMSGARAAARTKPVLAIKAGGAPAGARAAASHTGALAGSDAVYGAALARAGITPGIRDRGTLRRGRDAGPGAAAARRAPGHLDQRRRTGGDGRRCARRRRRPPGRARARHARQAGGGAARQLVGRRPGGHHRRRIAGALGRRARHSAR